MGQRRANRGPAPRSDLQILASDDIAALQAVESGTVSRGGTGVAAMFLADGVPVMLRRLEREDLCTAPMVGVPILLPRGQRLLATSRGELPWPLPD
jgi:hypothetical protein